MNFIKFWKSFLGPISFSFGGGGGGGPTQTTSTSQTSNIPEYAQPYVENMLASTQKQIYTTDPVTGEQTGFRPYQAYSSNPNDYVAGFSPLQQQAVSATGQLQTPGQFAPASNLAMASGIGSYGAGQQYLNQMQDPASMQSFMNPYQQGVTDVAKTAAVREAQMAQNASNLGAARQGTYGGARQTLANSERERNLLSNLSNIQAQGSNQAYTQGIQNQQFGANLGMQGYGQAGQAASTLGSLGSQQLGAQQGIINAQYGMGQQQQAMEQQKINQAIQDWSNTQQYPLMQLGVMSNMLRGLPMQAATTNQYVAAPNALTQGIGAVGAGASLYNALKGKKGGLPKEFESSGIKSYYEGELIESTKSDLYDLPLEELQKQAKSSPSDTVKRLANSIIRERTGKAGGGIIAFAEPNEANNQGVVKEEKEILRDEKKAEAAVNPASIVAARPREDYRSIPAAPAPAPVPVVESAPAATIAPAPAPVVKPASIAPAPTAQGKSIFGGLTEADIAAQFKLDQAAANRPLMDIYKEREAANKEAGIDTKVQENRRAEVMAERASSKDEAKRQMDMRMAAFFADWGTQPGNTLVGGMTALKKAIPDLIADKQEQRKYLKEINKTIYDLDNAVRLEKKGNMDKAEETKAKAGEKMQKWYPDLLKYQSDRLSDEAKIKAAGVTASKDTYSDKLYKDVFTDLVKNKGMDPKDPATAVLARKETASISGLTGEKLDVQRESAVIKGEKDSETLKALKMDRYATDEGSKERADIDAKISAEKKKIRDNVYKAPAADEKPVVTPTPVPKPAAAPAIPKAPDISTVAGAPAGSGTGAYVQGKGYEVRDKNGKLLGYAK